MKSHFALLLVAVMSFASFAKADTAKFSYHHKSHVLQLFDYPDKQVILFSGEIMPLQSNTKKQLRSLLSQLVPGKDILLAIGASGGGEATTYTNFGKALRNVCPRGECKITTYVHKSCASACVWLFMYGDDRVSSSVATFGFHRKFAGALGIEIVLQSRQELAKEFVNLGADPQWMAANIDRLTDHQKGGVYASPEQMIRAGMVTSVNDGLLNPMRLTLPIEFIYDYGIPNDGVLLTENPVAKN